jgi:hypothetical protein
MTRAFALASILLLLAFTMGASCQRDPVTPDNTGGTGGYWPTPPVTGGIVSTGGTLASGGWEDPFTGGTAGTGGAPQSEAEKVCQRLADVGCPEGYNPDCVAAVELIQNDERFAMDTACILRATTKAEVRGCNNAACGGVQ